MKVSRQELPGTTGEEARPVGYGMIGLFNVSLAQLGLYDLKTEVHTLG
jgi:hypothetical protein